MQDSPWPERLNELKAHIDAKRSGGRTAELMGLTAGQVIGAAHRRGWAFKSQPGHKYRKKSGGDRGWRPMPKPQTAQVAIEQPLTNHAPLSLDLQLYDLTNHTCRFPHGDSSPFLFCGHPTEGESSYCSFHKRLCCGPPPPMRGKMALRPF